MGRLFAAMTQGQALGEPLQNLTQLGLVSGEVRKQLLAVQGRSLSAADAMQALEKAFGGNAGAMERAAQTFNGLISTLQSTIQRLHAEFGKPIANALKPLIREATAFFEELLPVARRFGQILADALTAVRNAFSQGRLGELVGASMRLGFASALDFLQRGLAATAAGFVAFFSQSAVWESIGEAALEGIKTIGAAATRENAHLLLGPAGIAGKQLLDLINGPPIKQAPDVKGAWGNAQAAMKEAFGKSTIDLSGMRAEFAALWKDVMPNGEKRSGESGGLSGLASALLPSKNSMMAMIGAAFPIGGLLSSLKSALGMISGSGFPALTHTDQLTRIGGYIGGAPETEHARETARNTRALLRVGNELLTVARAAGSSAGKILGGVWQ
jgi:hypothetical protein